MLKLLNKLERRLRDLVNRWHALPYLHAMQHAGIHVVLGRGIKIEHPECVWLGDHVHLNDYCWISILKTNKQKGSPDMPLNPQLSIGDNTYIGRFATIACMSRVAIGNDVMISDRVFIGDTSHGYARTDLPIKDQYQFSPGPVSIGDGSWIGINVSILPDVKIGRNCVIGANSVVTKDIPDFHIAAGVPAKIMRRTEPQ